jgi:3-hydroxyisobutyrate dehydrogenase-like beta-hydroxyacid dehydrogenase
VNEEPIGFVGLGGMGRGLVKNLLKHGRAVRVLDRDAAAVATARELGATPAADLAELREACGAVAFCVSTAEDVEALVIGEGGLLAADLRPGQIVIDHTTTNPETVDRLDRAITASGGRFAEAPMTRTPKHAEAGCVNVLYGGGAELLAELEPVFRCYAENVFHIGPTGHAIRLKLIHNYIAFANVAAWCEGFALAAKEGLDLSRAIEIISAAGARSGMLDLYGQATLERDFTPWMSLANARKDVRYYARWLEDAGLPGGLAESVHQGFRLAEILGHDEESCTAVIKVYERLGGVEARLS